MEADGASLTPSLCHCSILRVFKVTATQIREKSEQTLESLRIELGTSSTEGSALINCATRLLLTNNTPNNDSNVSNLCGLMGAMLMDIGRKYLILTLSCDWNTPWLNYREKGY